MSDSKRLIRWDGRKWGNRLHWQIDAWRLGEDDHGVWAFVPAGTQARRGQEPPIRLPNDAVWLIPDATWWTIEFTPDGDTPVYVNIGMPVTWDGDRVTQIDLDLDVIRTRSGETLVIDHDEFEDHQVRFGYPPEIVNATERAAEQSLAMLRKTDPPFDGCHAEWMMRTR
jgi:hypothetical protein